VYSNSDFKFSVQTGRKKERGTTEEEMEGPTPLWGLRNRKNA